MAEMEVRPGGVALITISNPPVNALSIDVWYSLKDNYEEALRRNDVKAIVVTGKGGVFSGGLDINTFGFIQRNKAEQLNVHYVSMDIMTNTLEAAGKPSVAAINGLALGGGLEISMVCQARISIPTAQLGLPELQLGVIPAFGGTQLLPRLVGLTKALEMMLMSNPIKAEEAHQLGLVDAIVSPNDLLNTACRWALDISESRRPWVHTLHRTDKLESPDEAREILKFARAQVQKQAANLRHPLVCIDVIEEGIVSGPRAGLRKEAIAFQDLVFSDTCKSLVHVFFSQHATSKVPGITDLGLMPRKVAKVAIVGGGLMGSGIATALMLSNYPVVLKEVNEKFLNAGIDRIKANLQSRVRKGKMTKEKYEKMLSLLIGVVDYERFKEVDLVIEAVVENVKVKQQVFADLERYCPSHCVLATNTSTIDLDLIGEKTNSQDRIVGAHFFSPAHVMPLLEIVHSKRTSPQVVVDLLDVGKKIKKTPVVVGNCTGFAVNRMFSPYTSIALLLVDRGMNVYKIDQVCTEFGMPMGPFRLLDLVGFGVALASGMEYLENSPENVDKSMLIPLMFEDKRTGEASQKGFYKYEGNRKAIPDPDIINYVEKSRSMAGTLPDLELLKLDDKDIVEMVFFPVINEACQVLSEDIATKASDLDVASIFGMGFPPYRGGIMYWADSIGAKRIHTRLSEWEMKYGQFFRPCSYLSERAAEGVPLSATKNNAKARLSLDVMGYHKQLGFLHGCLKGFVEWCIDRNFYLFKGLRIGHASFLKFTHDTKLPVTTFGRRVPFRICDPHLMAEPPSQSPAQTPPPPPQQQGPGESARDDMMACVAALEAALLPCLPARELQAVDRSLQSSHQIDVERHARDFMEAAKKLQSYFISLQREDRPSTEEMLRKDIAIMEEELKTKSELIDKHKKLIEGWQKELKDQLGKHVTELERV